MPEVNGIPVINDYIELREDCLMYAQYRRRGESPRAKTFPAGARVQYTTFPMAGRFAARNIDEITHWQHTVTKVEGQFTYSATKDVPVKKEANNG